MNAGDVWAIFIGAVVAVPVAVVLALLWVSLQRREPIPWRDMWRALTRRERG
jgi:NADH:ubiquinone oxidoreductase subunit K